MCTTEIIAFSKANTYFERLNTCLLGLSVDSNASHLAWIYDIYYRTGIQISFPIIADRSGEIARKYGMIASDVSTTETVRNVFIIDPKGIVRLILVYPLNVGRSISEILRAVQALQVADLNKASTPANWIPNQPIIIPPPKTFEELLKRKEEMAKEQNGMSWYLNFRNPQEKLEDREPRKTIENKKINEFQNFPQKNRIKNNT